MAQRLALVQCINPAHKDDTPSMAVYDHGKKKLQVFCFGCKFHGWVTPSQINTTSNTTDTKVSKDVVVTGIHLPTGVIQQKVKDFFTQRNFADIPWKYLTYGSEVFGNKIRPYVKWTLYDFNSHIVGYQFRFLDEEKPKIKTMPVGGKYPQFAWHNPTMLGGVRITESWVDAQCLDHRYGVKKTLILLGTQPTKVDWYKFLVDCGANTSEVAVHLWFDGDKAGMECANRLWYILTSLGATVTNDTVEGKKVYEV